MKRKLSWLLVMLLMLTMTLADVALAASSSVSAVQDKATNAVYLNTLTLSGADTLTTVRETVTGAAVEGAEHSYVYDVVLNSATPADETLTLKPSYGGNNTEKAMVNVAVNGENMGNAKSTTAATVQLADGVGTAVWALTYEDTEAETKTTVTHTFNFKVSDASEIHLGGEAKIDQTLQINEYGKLSADTEAVRNYQWWRVYADGTEKLVGEDASYVVSKSDYDCTVRAELSAAGYDTLQAVSGKVTYMDSIAEAQVNATVTAADAEAAVTIFDSKGIKLAEGVGSATSAEILINSQYSWSVTKSGMVYKTGEFGSTGDDITVEGIALEAAEDTSANNWVNFRNSQTHMAITDAKTSQDSATAYLKWSAKKGSYCTPPIIVDDCIVAAWGTNLFKLSMEDGSIVASGKMSAQGMYTLFQPAYGDGKIFMQQDKGKIEAFDAATLKSLWQYTGATGAYASAPIIYHDGYVYTGWGSNSITNGDFVCVDAKTGEQVWKNTSAGGFYWNGAVIVGNAVVAVDQGGNIYCWDAKTGKQIGETIATGHKVSTVVSYSAEQGKAYFTAYDKTGTVQGYLCSVKVDAATGALSDYKEVNFTEKYAEYTSGSSTPVVYGNYVYFGAAGKSGGMLVAKADTLEIVNSVASKGAVKGSALLSDAYLESEGCLYLYNTYNNNPGGITLVKVKVANPAAADGLEFVNLWEPDGSMKQYNMNSVICDANGVLYFKNDSGYIFAVDSKVNNAPGLTGDAEIEAEVKVGKAYELDLSKVFCDADGDNLTYTVQIGEDEPVSVETAYSFTADKTGTYTLVFKADDGVTESAAYTVILTVKAAGGNGGETAAKSITVYVTLSDDNGEFFVGSGGEMWKMPVELEKSGGKFMLDDAVRAAHEEYYSGGADGYAGGVWISKLWGEESYNVSFVVNNAWVESPAAEVEDGDVVTAFIYQDTSADYCDLLTWFAQDDVKATVGTAKTFTVKGLSVMKSGAGGAATGVPYGADVTVYDEDENEVSDLATTVDKDGKFSITFTEKGNYTLLVNGTADYSCRGAYGSGTFEDAPVVPSYCMVKVSGGSSGSGTDNSVSDSVDESAAVVIEKRAEVDENGVAEVNIKQTAVVDAMIEAAEDEGISAIIITPDIEGKADKIVVEIPRAALAELVDDKTKLDLTLNTELARLTISNEGLADIIGNSGKEVSVAVSELKNAAGRADGKLALEIALDGEVVKKIAGGIQVVLPVKQQSAGNVLMIVGEDGSEEVVRKSLADGPFVQAVLDGSCIVKVVDNSKYFVDMGNHWGKEAVAFASSHELFNGVTANEFAPNAKMNRAMLATVLWRLSDETVAEGKVDFTDVDAASWYGEAVAWAADNRIVTGDGEGKFAPEQNVSREQLGTMLYRYADILGLDTEVKGELTGFADADKVADYAEKAMLWAVDKGVISGKGESLLDPAGNATRAEVAVVMQRMVGLLFD